jgi:diadenosine tetraphosphate (Ap4A) HIT family hydrolase
VTAGTPHVAGCAFCAIARGDDQSVEVVCESHQWIAFFPRDPATPGHTLVIPRRHVEDLWEADAELGGALMTAVIRVGRAIEAALHPEGMNLITSSGSAAEQTVFHLHLHLVPRWKQDGFGRIWPTGARYDDNHLERAAGRVRKACVDVEEFTPYSD